MQNTEIRVYIYFYSIDLMFKSLKNVNNFVQRN